MQGTSERRTIEIGREILTRAREAEPSMLRPEWWTGRLLDRLTADPRRKVQLFRLVDVLPSLTSEQDIVRHLDEYLLQDGIHLPIPARALLRAGITTVGLRRLLAAATWWGASLQARTYIAGRGTAGVLETVQDLRRRGMGFTIDVLGEATTSDAQADRYAEGYLHLLRELAAVMAGWAPLVTLGDMPGGASPRVNVSLKLSSLDPHFDPMARERSIDTVLGRLRPIFREARRLGAFVNIDMERYAVRDLTLEVFRRLLDEDEFRGFRDAGIVLQAYLRDAAADLDALISWVEARGVPITVRLVKGAYWDVETVEAIQNGWPIPVLTNKWHSDAQFEAMARTLFDHRALLRPALASHNIRSLAASLAYAEEIGATPREFEIQMLYGMGDPLKQAVVDMGYALRVYTPCGDLIPGMAYLIRRLLENTANESFLLQTFHRKEPPETLLADPAQTRPPNAPPPSLLFADPQEDETMTPFAFEPVADFSREDTRRSMAEALGDVRRRFGRAYPLVIGGRRVETDQVVDSLNPSDRREVVGRACWGSATDLNEAVAVAREAFENGWASTDAARRRELLHRVADVMRRRRFELSAWIILEAGKPWREADADVAEAIDFCEFYGQEMERLERRPRLRNFPGEGNAYVYSPRGVVGVIAPWNFPLAILAGMTTAALAAGNTVVMKPAEQTPVVASMLMEAFVEAGLPDGVVNLVMGRGDEVGARLVEHPGVDMIAFTGSREVGVWIYEQAAKWHPGQRYLKRVVAEMGGKNAIIVDADADLDEAVVGVVASTFGYAGQKCSACSRAIVMNAVRGAFTERLVEAVRSLPIGSADDPATIVGPLIDEDARRKVMEYIEVGRREAKLAWKADLGALADRGFYAPPTVFVDVPLSARVAREEIFGPVLAVIGAADFDEALRIANDSDYALTGGLYSRSPRHLDRARREFKVGNLYINRKITGAIVDRQPFGGSRMSGVGSKAGGPDYLLQFMEPKTITESTLRHGFAPETTAGSAVISP